MPDLPQTAKLTCLDLGFASYASALDVQERLVDRVAQRRDADGYLILVEHKPAVITLGRSAEAQNILASREQLATIGVEVHESRRGGDVTWHGPGQIVGYPILRLDVAGRSVRTHMRRLEEGVMALLAGLGLTGRRIEGMTGVWVGDDDEGGPAEKVAAIGVAVRKWVSYHGFALNVCCDLEQFAAIVPCGLADKGVTSLAKLLSRDVSVEQIKAPLVEHMAAALGFGSVANVADEGEL